MYIYIYAFYIVLSSCDCCLGCRPYKNPLTSLFSNVDSMCSSADYADFYQISFGQNTEWTHASTLKNNPPASAIPATFLLDFYIDVPYISCHCIGASLYGPLSQCQLDAKLLHITRLGHGCQSVGASAP